MISAVQLESATDTKQEFVQIYNLSSDDVDLNGWFVKLLFSTGSVNRSVALDGTLKPHSYALITSTEYSAVPTNPAADFTTHFTANMTGTGGHAVIIDSLGSTVDRLGWGTAVNPEPTAAAPPANSQMLQRKKVNDVFVDTDNNSVDFERIAQTVPIGGGVYEPVDVCPNNDAYPGNQASMPVGAQLNASGDCEPSITEYPVISLSEILPDPGSPKTDANDEFIELYNPNDVDVDVTGYHIVTGSSLSSDFTLPAYVIPKHGFLTLYSSETKIGLTNSGGKLQLQSPDKKPMGDVFEYAVTGTDQVWAYLDDGWKLSDKPTPNAQNEIVVLSEEPGMGGGEATSTPCPEGKYRNPLTNRCRNIEADASVLATCAEDEYRNPDTNRCRKAVLAAATITPCQEGYERNPDTNRCRKIANESTAPKPCDPGQERNPDTGRCRKITVSSKAANVIDSPQKKGLFNTNSLVLGIAGVGAIGYGVYEWRSEIGGAFGKLAAKLGKK